MAKKEEITKLIDDLNYDLAGELGAIIQYLQHHYVILGMNRLPISELLEEQAKDEMKHADALSKRIVALGGRPTVKPRPVREERTIRKMLEADLEGEREALRDYSARRDYCEKIGEVGTALLIEDIITDEQEHHDALVMLLAEQE